MKIRSGFVSNSSSSSFVCDICGETAEGWDLSLTDCDYYECVNGHCLCADDLLEEYSYELDEDDPEWDEELAYNYQMPEKYCPICNFIEPDEILLGNYLGEIYKITKDEVFKEIKAKNKRRKKLYDKEYVAYIMAKNNLNLSDLLKELKDKFETFENFRNNAKEKS